MQLAMVAAILIAIQALKRLRVSASATQKAATVVTTSTSPWRITLSGHWSMKSGRTSSTALVSGSQSEMARTTGGNCARGKNTPYKNIMGVSTSVK